MRGRLKAEGVCVYIYIYIYIYIVLCQSLSCVRLFAIPWTVVHRGPLSMEFSRQEYWSGLHSLLQGIFSTQGSNLGLLHCRQILYHLSHQGNPIHTHTHTHTHTHICIVIIDSPIQQPIVQQKPTTQHCKTIILQLKNKNRYINKMENQQGPTVQHRKLCSILCNNLNGKQFEKE